MPRYFFETNDEDFRFQDEVGVELAGPQAARVEALSALPDMAQEHIPGRDTRTFVSIVRDARGDVVFEGTLRWKASGDRRKAVEFGLMLI
jgi:hypothetical protein